MFPIAPECNTQLKPRAAISRSATGAANRTGREEKQKQPAEGQKGTERPHAASLEDSEPAEHTVQTTGTPAPSAAVYTRPARTLQPGPVA